MSEKTFICARHVECLIEVKAHSLEEALASLPSTPDDLVETADGVAFGPHWEVQIDGVKSTPQLFDDADVEEAKQNTALPTGGA